MKRWLLMDRVKLLTECEHLRIEQTRYIGKTSSQLIQVLFAQLEKFEAEVITKASQEQASSKADQESADNLAANGRGQP